MADRTITSLTEVTSVAGTALLVVDSGGATVKIQRNNIMPLRGSFTVLDEGDVDLTNDRIWILDNTDGRLKEISLQDILFGNFTNENETDDFTLDPQSHHARPVECTGAFTTSTITLDASTADQGGAVYNIVNYTSATLTVALANSMVLYEDGASVASATIRENTIATISVKDDNLEAIFAGG